MLGDGRNSQLRIFDSAARMWSLYRPVELALYNKEGCESKGTTARRGARSCVTAPYASRSGASLLDTALPLVEQFCRSGTDDNATRRFQWMIVPVDDFSLNLSSQSKASRFMFGQGTVLANDD